MSLYPKYKAPKNALKHFGEVLNLAWLSSGLYIYSIIKYCIRSSEQEEKVSRNNVCPWIEEWCKDRKTYFVWSFQHQWKPISAYAAHILKSSPTFPTARVYAMDQNKASLSCSAEANLPLKFPSCATSNGFTSKYSDIIQLSYVNTFVPKGSHQTKKAD